MSTPRYEIQTGSGKSAYITQSTATRLIEAFKRYDETPVHPSERKRLLRNGKVLLRQQGDGNQHTLDLEVS